MKSRPQALFIIAFLLVVISVTMCSGSDNTDFASAREMIVMRSIGHKILLSSGDSSSRVLQVSKTNPDQYHIRFESSFQFTPDSIVRIIRQMVEANHLPSDYIVNVVECGRNQVIFGFAILQTEQTNLVPCIGTKQPKACYSVSITFRDTFLALNKDYFIGAGGGLAALMLIFSGLRISHRQKKTADSLMKPLLVTSKVILIGNYKFHSDKQYLEYDQEQTGLSEKESKLLYVLSTKLNELVERTELQKVWEDEGVIVSRSLDMFISKLRKKLENDPAVRLVNVHGRGYKLEVI